MLSSATKIPSLSSHLKNSFFSQNFADFLLILNFNGQELQIKTHKLILSLYINNLEGPSKEINTNDMYLTRDAIVMVVASLYGNELDLENDLDQLLSITSACKLFQLDCTICIQKIKSKISTKTVRSIAEFLEKSIHEFQDLRDALFTYLCRQFIENVVLENGPIWHEAKSKSYDYAVGTLSNLPFEWIKAVVESKHFDVPSDMERFQFAKAIIERRQSLNGVQAGIQLIYKGDENVLLSFGSKSNGVTVIKKILPRQRRVWKSGH